MRLNLGFYGVYDELVYLYLDRRYNLSFTEVDKNTWLEPQETW